MKKKKIIALVISIVILVCIALIYYFLTQNKEQNLPITSHSEKVGDNLISIKGGTFQMGSLESEYQRGEDEKQHSVTLDDFYISAFEVTQREYQNIMGENPSNFKGDNLPVESITWYQAIEYCNKLSEKEGLTPVYEIDGENVTWILGNNGYRLPTEAEWEYSSRAGTTTPFNTETSIGDDEANYYGHYPYGIEENYFSQGNLETEPGEYRETTLNVGSFQPNKWGLYDMHGNVGEWVFDYYSAYDTESTVNPTGPTTGTLRVNRGGGWNDYAKHLRSAYRASTTPTQKMSNIGFRIARNSESNTSDTVISDKSSSNTNDYTNANILIAYFSWSGNTEQAAEIIADKTGGHLFEIELEKPYSSNYNTVLDQAQKDLNSGARPKIANEIDSFEQYDVIMIGYPNWWATIPMPIASLLEQYNFDGKTIIPFCSHGGGGFGQSITDISKLAPNSTIEEGLSIHYSGGSTLSSDISNWLEKLGINEK